MHKYSVKHTGNERRFDEKSIIVSKTDLKGRLTYVNDVFCQVGLYTTAELIGQPHSIVRHPDMPRCVFKLLWDTLQAGHEIFAYVKNMAKNGDHYWVLAHVTPTFGPAGRITGYHSNRRTARREAVAEIEPLYRTLLAEEAKHAGKREQVEASTKVLHGVLAGLGVPYDEFVWSLEHKYAGAAR